jgi:HD-GYP domain-containing protein (c-di-GMP phosphodiesterase class II)
MSTSIEGIDWASHAVHVATLAVKLGARLKVLPDDLRNLALAGLLHGVGMMSMPRSVLEQPGRLTPKQWEVIKTHPLWASEFLGQLGPEFEWLQTSILQEHERHRGQGYPHGIAGKDIHLFARLIGLADTYVAMTQARPWRPAISPHDAAKEIVYQRKNEFDPKLIKCFLQSVTIFPVTCLVKLNNHEIAKVVAINEDSPLRPTVEIISSPANKPTERSRIVDLREHPLLYITGTASQRELSHKLE